METIIQLAALGLCAAVIAQLLKKSEEALALLVVLAALLVGCAALGTTLSALVDFCARVLLLTQLPTALFVPLGKVAAISLIVRFSSALCTDARQSAISALLQTAGALCALACALPLLEELLGLVEGFL